MIRVPGWVMSLVSAGMNSILFTLVLFTYAASAAGYL